MDGRIMKIYLFACASFAWLFICILINLASSRMFGINCTPVGFAIGCLACYRAVRLIRCDDLPFNVGGWIRKQCGVRDGLEPQPGTIADMITCPKCLSIWFAMPIASVMTRNPLWWFVVVLGLSAVAIFLSNFDDLLCQCRPGMAYRCPPWRKHLLHCGNENGE